MNNKCTLCGKVLLSKPTRLIEQHYFKKPYARYVNVEKWDLCIECYKEILLSIEEKKKSIADK